MSVTPKEREHYFVRLDSGEVCEVSREVYLCYYAGGRKERYQAERDRKNGLVSIEAMADRMFEDGEGRNYAKMLGITRYAVEKRRDEVLTILRNNF